MDAVDPVEGQRSARRAAWPRPFRPRISPKVNYALHGLVEPNRLNRGVARFLERRPRLRRVFTSAEKSVKEAGFGCQMCGQCALPITGYACPQTCPKQLRNGPCGGVAPNGDCEVYPGTRCVWLVAYERLEKSDRTQDMSQLLRPLDHRLADTSSWINYWQGRDENLWSAPLTVANAPAWPALAEIEPR